jgi:hypothetical protein
MSITIPAILTSETFQIWLDRTNQIANAISTVAVTVNTHANGGLTTGNGFVEGTFGARNLVGNTIHGGTVQTPALMTMTSNLAITGSTLFIGNVVINSSAITVDGQILATGRSEIAVNTSGTGTQEIDNWDKLLNRGAEYFITIKDNNANAVHGEKMVVIHDSGDAYYTRTSVVWSNTSQGDFSANANGTHVRVYLTPTSTNAHISGTRVTVDV